jgi:hypothetical protein
LRLRFIVSEAVLGLHQNTVRMLTFINADDPQQSQTQSFTGAGHHNGSQRIEQRIPYSAELRPPSTRRGIVELAWKLAEISE